ncbi:hypothetical protein GO003_024085 [Methylicorpusculum oleiharenae]|uniref:hypothetical protein n=1 Tax=Methylicorpusculum oleiharenae TaxID=1338687 RepID=UPI00135725C5|nr:hypothetical protein [Methylicorpusculum oleiharenae]MCD2453464.1 hypothetical protein [Methylicorpusculum oleiharenae]
MAENTQTPPKRESSFQYRRQFIENCRNSKIIEKATFTDAVMRVYRLRFREISRSAYLTRFYCSIGRGQSFDVEQKVTREMIAIINGVKENIDKKIVVADQIINNSSIRIGQAQYESVNVTIIDPIAMLFLNALNSARDLEEKLRVLWLACKLTDIEKRQALTEIEKEFNDAHQRCQALMIGVRNRFNEQRRAREEEARTAGGQDQHFEELAVSETEIISAVEQDESSNREDAQKKSSKKISVEAQAEINAEIESESA